MSAPSSLNSQPNAALAGKFAGFSFASWRGLPASMALPFGILALLVLLVLPIPSLLLDMFFVLNIDLI